MADKVHAEWPLASHVHFGNVNDRVGRAELLHGCPLDGGVASVGGSGSESWTVGVGGGGRHDRGRDTLIMQI